MQVEKDGNPVRLDSVLQKFRERSVVGAVNFGETRFDVIVREATAPDFADPGKPSRDQAQTAPDFRRQQQARSNHASDQTGVDLCLVAIEVDPAAWAPGYQGRRAGVLHKGVD